jgi:hypothetical protein
MDAQQAERPFDITEINNREKRNLGMSAMARRGDFPTE